MKDLHKIKKHLKNPVITIGTFDGVHLGHQLIMKRVVERAKALDGVSVVITYHPHPIEILKRQIYPFLITEKCKKEEFLRQMSVDYVLWMDFDLNLAHLSPQDFIRDHLCKSIGAKEIIVGYDWHFGKDRTGDYHLLKELEPDFCYHVEMIEEVIVDGEIVSSTAIREYLHEGNIKRANKMLGRNFSILGTVEKGNRIGTGIGYPTSNLKPIEPRKIFPGIGVYLTRVNFDDENYWGLTNVGTRPTIDKNNRQKNVETHILDFNKHIYQKKVELFFLEKIRDEIEFDSLPELVKQIKKDEQYALQLIKKDYNG